MAGRGSYPFPAVQVVTMADTAWVQRRGGSVSSPREVACAALCLVEL